MSGESDKYVCIEDFEAIYAGEISIKVTERFEVLSKENYRWLVRRVQMTEEGETEGAVPCKHLVKEKSVKYQRWFIDIDQTEAETLLLSDPNVNGSFLVRPNKDSKYCLSVRKNDEVIHYAIQNEDPGIFFIDEEKTFSCVHDLVHYYRHNFTDGNTNPLIIFLNVTKDSWERPSSDFILRRKLESLHRFPLWEGVWEEGGKKVLIEAIPKADFEKGKFQDGIDILKTLDHRNVIKLYALCTTEDPLYVVTEFMEKGDLLRFLRGEKGLLLKLSELMHIAEQVADGMAYLEVKRVVHCQLACLNILVGNQLCCKISHFEVAVRTQGEHFLMKGKFPVKWLPPEFYESGICSKKTDVWSFGIVLYELFTLGQQPYTGLSIEDTQEKVTGGYRLPMPPLCPANIYTLMLKCWHEDPKERPSFQEIVEQRMFQ